MSPINKRKLCKFVSVLATSLALTVPIAANALTLRIGHNAPAEDPRTWASEEFAKRISEKSNGAMEAQIFPSGQLGDTKEMLEGLKIRTLDIYVDDPGSLGVYGDTANLPYVPFLYRDADHFFKVNNSALGKKIIGAIEKDTGYIPLGLMFRGGREISSVKPLNTAEDFKGLKIRVPSSPMMLEGFKSMETSPIAMGFTEVFGALQRKVIDAQENPIDLIYNSSLYEVAPYIVLSDHIYGAYSFIMWGDRFNQLSKEEQAIIQEASDYVSKEYNEMVFKMLDEKLNQLKAIKGVTVTTLPQEEKNKLSKGIDKVVMDNYPNLMPIIEEIRNFK